MTSRRNPRNITSLLLLPSAVLCGGFLACSGDDTSPSAPPATANDAGAPMGTDHDDASLAPDVVAPGDAAGDVPVDPASAQVVRAFIGAQVGGIAKLAVPPDDSSIPVPPDDPKRPGRYK